MAKTFKDYYKEKAVEKVPNEPFRDFLLEKNIIEKPLIIEEDTTPFRVVNGVFQYSLNENWNDLFSLDELRGMDGADGLSGVDGIDGIGRDGREVVLSLKENNVVWNYLGEEDSHILLSLSSLKGKDGKKGSSGLDGKDGKSVSLKIIEDSIVWNYLDEEETRPLISLDEIRGKDGVDGKEVVFQKTNEEVQWKYINEDTWNTLYLLEELRGKDGKNGLSGKDGKTGKSGIAGKDGKNGIAGKDGVDGKDGKNGIAGKDGVDGKDGKAGNDGRDGPAGREVTLRNNDGNIQYTYKGESSWETLFTVSTIKGEKGDKGDRGEQGKEGKSITGEKGQKGDRGDRGEKGEQGETGLAGEKGKDGTDAKQVALVRNGNLVQWKYTDDDKLRPLFSLKELTGGASAFPGGGPGPRGFAGEPGTRGVDGRKVLLRKYGVYIQYSYEGDTTWENLYELEGSAGSVVIDSTNFNNFLSIEDDTLQKVLEKVNNIEDSSVAYAKQIDFIDDYIYKGEAVPGSLASAPAWRISKTYIDVSDDITITWAGGTSAFDKIWDNHLALVYS